MNTIQHIRRNMMLLALGVIFLSSRLQGQTPCTAVVTTQEVSCFGGATGSASLQLTGPAGGGSSTCQSRQAAPINCTSGCTRTITDASTAITIGTGEVVCLRSTSLFTGGITFNGGHLIICANAKPSFINFNNGNNTYQITVLGSLEVGSLNLTDKGTLNNYGTVTSTGSCGFNALFLNHGDVVIGGDLSINSSLGLLNNYGTIQVANAFNNFNTTNNYGTLSANGNIHNNGGQNFLNNYCTLNTTKELINNSQLNNYSKITVGQWLRVNGGSQIRLFSNSGVETVNLQHDGTFLNTEANCGLIKVSNTAQMNWGSAVNGKISLCDANGIEQNNTTYSNGAGANCTCTIEGGVSGSTITWNSPLIGTGTTKTGISAGTYTVNVQIPGCSTITRSFTISQPSAALNATSTQTSTSVNTSVSGGTVPYSYVWSGPNGFTATTANISGLSPGTYTVLITDAKGCTATTSQTITSTTNTCNFSHTQVDPKCNGDKTGSITLTGLPISTGTLGTLYTCTDGTVVSGNAIQVGPGQVRRLEGSNAVNSIVIDGGTLITCGSTVLNNTFEIKNGGTLFCLGSFTFNSPITVPAGTRIINMYQSMVFNQAINVTGLLYNVNGSMQCQTQLNVTGKVVNWTDFGANNFQINSGGSVDHYGRWDTKWGSGTVATGGQFNVYANASIDIKDFSNTGQFTALSGTGACFKISNTYINTSTGSISAANGASLNLCYGGALPSGAVIGTGVIRNNSSASCTSCMLTPPSQVNVSSLFGNSGGSTVTVSWTSTVAGFVPVSGQGANAPLTISQLGAGVYTATVQISGCSTITRSFTINQPAQLVITSSSQAADAVSATPSGGTAPYSYVWSGPNNFSATTASISGLLPGTYVLVVTDANGCTATSTQVISPPASTCTYSATKVEPSCNGGSTGSITLTGLPTSGGGALGTLYTCTDGTLITGNVINVGPGQVRRLEGSNAVSSIVIDGGTLITCGSTLVNNTFEIKNGGTLFCIGSFTSNAPVVVPTGSRIINMYQAMSFNQAVTVAGLLYNVNGSLQCQTQLTVSGKVVNWTDFGATNFQINSGGSVDHYGRWDTKWGNGVINTGGVFNVYGNSSMDIKDFTNTGQLIAASGTASCFKISNSYVGSSTGSITVATGAGLSLCYSGVVPTAASIGTGVTRNNSSAACTGCTLTPPNPVDINTLFGGSGNGCTIAWTSTAVGFVPISGQGINAPITINQLGAGTYTATISCPSCSTKTVTVVLNNPSSTPIIATVSVAGGVATVSAPTGGNGGPYTYKWLPENVTTTTRTRTFTTNGLYYVNVIDVKGCETSFPFNITGLTDSICYVSIKDVAAGKVTVQVICPTEDCRYLIVDKDGISLAYAAQLKKPCKDSTVQLINCKQETFRVTLPGTGACTDGCAGLPPAQCPCNVATDPNCPGSGCTPFTFPPCPCDPLKDPNCKGCISEKGDCPKTPDDTTLCDGSIRPCPFLKVTYIATPPKCGQLGQASLSISGGSGNYSVYSDNRVGNLGTTITGLAVGWHLVKVEDNVTKKSTKLYVVIPPTPKSQVSLVTSAAAGGECKNQFVVTITQANTGPYNITSTCCTPLNSGPLNAINGVLTAGPYTIPATAGAEPYLIRITDANCTTYDKLVTKCNTICTDPAAATYQPIITKTKPSYQGRADGSLLLTNLPAGTTAYWVGKDINTPITGTSAANLKEGTYTLVITNTLTNCLYYSQENITLEDGGTYYPTYKLEDGCTYKVFTTKYTATGTIDNLAPAGLLYTWLHPITGVQIATGNTINLSTLNLSLESLVLRITDAQGNISTHAFQIPASCRQILPVCGGTVNFQLTNPTCENGTDGKFRILAIPANTTVRWLNPAAGSNALEQNGLGQGTYSFAIVSTNNSCISSIYSGSISSGAVPIVATVSVAGAQARVSTPSGGNGGPYTYKWDNETNFVASNSKTFLENGSYDVVVRDAKGCTKTLTFSIGAISGTDCEVLVETKADQLVYIKVVCPEDETSCKYQIVTKGGGLLPYGAGLVAPCRDTVVVSANCKGDTIRTGINGNGKCISCNNPGQICPCDPCKDKNCPAVPGTPPCLETDLNMTYIATPPRCGNLGIATLTITNGSGNYSIYTDQTVGSQGMTIYNLASGEVQVTIIDNISKQSKLFKIVIPTSPRAAVSIVPVIAGTCNNTFNVAINNATAGPYTLEMSCCAPFYINTLNPINGVINTGPYSVPTTGGNGPFTVKITDANCNTYTELVNKCNGCPPVNFVPNVTVTQPSLKDKKDGVLVLNNLPSGITAYWSGTNLNGLVSGTTLSGLGAGTYKLVLKGNDPCAYYTSPAYELIDGTSCSLTFSNPSNCVYVAESPNCLNKLVQPIQYQWINPANGAILATGSQLDVSAFASTLVLNYLTVRLTDAANNRINSYFVIPNRCLPTDPICQGIIGYKPRNPICYNGEDGKIEISQLPANSSIYWLNPALRATGASARTKNFLGAGKYSFVVLDNNNVCPPKRIDVYLNNPKQIKVGRQELANGSLRIDVSNGLLPYTYKWIHDQRENQDTPQIRTDLTPGNSYTVNVRDKNGCPGSTTFEYSPCRINPVGAVAVLTQNTSNEQIAARIVPSGGVPAYRYLWNNNNLIDPTNAVQLDLSRGVDYEVTVTDARGCSTLVNVLQGNCTITATFTSTATSQSDICDGTATIAVTKSGNPVTNFEGWTLLWDEQDLVKTLGLGRGQYQRNSQITINNVCGGNHQVYVMDNETKCGVVFDTKVAFGPKVEVPCNGVPIIIAPVTNYTKKCFNDPLDINFAVNGGRLPYRYDWERVYNSGSGAVTERYTSDKAGFTNAAYGDYTVTVRDQNGCNASKKFTITGPTALLKVTAVPVPLRCEGEQARATANVQGGAGSYQVVWTKQIDGSIANANALVLDEPYVVTVTDGLGCSATDMTLVNSLNVTFNGKIFSSNDSLCPRSNVTLTAKIVSGYSVQWYGPLASVPNEGATPLPTFGVGSQGARERITIDKLGTYVLRYTPTGGNTCPARDKAITIVAKRKCSSVINICDNEVFTVSVTIPETEDNCTVQKRYIAQANAIVRYREYIEAAKRDFRAAYKAEVMASLNEQITKGYSDQEGHYTLYYYDQGGNLVRTVPPAGVKPLNTASTSTAISRMKAKATDQIYPSHTLATTYTYNSLNQLVAQDMPDHRQQDLWTLKDALNLPAGQTAKTVNYSPSGQGYLFANTATEAKLYTSADQGKTWTPNIGVQLDDIFDVYAQGSLAWAVGKSGLLLKGNGTDQWTLWASPTKKDLISVYFASANEGRIFASDGSQWNTNDGGLTWTAVNGLTATGLTNISSIWNQDALVVAAGQKAGVQAIYYSNNNGASFTQQQFTAGPYGALALDNGQVIVGGALSASYRLDAFGRLVVQHHTNLDGFVRKLIVNGTQRTALVTTGQNVALGNVFGSSDGKTWTALTTSGNIETISNLGSSVALVGNNQWSEGSGAAASISNVTELKNIVNINKPLLSNPSISNTLVALGSPLSYRIGNSGNNWQTLTIQGYTVGTRDLYVNAVNDWLVVGNDFVLRRTQLAAAVNNVIPVNTLALRGNSISNVFSLHAVGTQVYAFKTNGAITRLTLNADGTISETAITSQPNSNTPWTTTDILFESISGNLRISFTSSNDGSLWQYDNNTWTNKSLVLVPNQINSVTGTSDQNIVAVGGNGEIYKKANNWNSEWNFQGLKSEEGVLHRASLEGMQIRVSKGSEILRYDNTTRSLTIESSTTGNVTEMSSTLAATQDGKLYDRSGSTWTEVFSDAQQRPITGVSGNVAAGPQQLYYQAGSAWALAQPIKIQPIQAVSSSSSIGLVAVGDNNTILVSSNGSTWQSKPLGLAQNQQLTAVGRQGSQIVIGGANGALYYSNNTGDIWTAASSLSSPIRQIVMPAANQVWVVQGNTLRYSNNLSTYNTVLTASQALHSISIDAEGYGFVVGDQGISYRIQPLASFEGAPAPTALANGLGIRLIATDATTNDDKGTGIPVADLRQVQFVDRLTGHITGSNGLVLKTVDGGYHWQGESSGGGSGTPILALGKDRAEGTLVAANGSIKSLGDQAAQLGSKYWYDELGRLILSQNVKQYNIEKHLNEQQYAGITVAGTGTVRAYSVTLYDEIGRIKSTFELLTRKVPPTIKVNTQVKYSQLVNDFINGGFKLQITNTYFDEAVFTDILQGFSQENLRPMISSVTHQDREGSAYQHATHYSYDLHKNVNVIVQEFNVAGTHFVKRIDYDYDLNSGKLNFVYYQKDQPDQLIHKYTYDGDNRMVSVYTTRDGINWLKDATYSYYGHENIAQIKLGEHAVETQNYAFTLQGWTKALLGQNFSFALSYNDNDYRSTKQLAGDAIVPLSFAPSRNLYNKNIAAVSSYNTKIETALHTEQYTYDQLSRLIKSSIDGNTNKSFSTRYSYDANTNLLEVSRHDLAGIKFDSLKYNYETKEAGYLSNTNRLRHVKDLILNSAYTNDLESQDNDNYQYDEVGNIILDDLDGTERIEYNTNQKIKFLKRRSTSSKPDVEFVYDANLKHRIAKIVKYKNGTIKKTYYINDAAGNTLAIYKQEQDGNVQLTEQYVYGEDKLATINTRVVDVQQGNREYELRDHLESVRATVRDLPVNGQTEVVNAFDYYPYGMLAKSYNAPEYYRYGYVGWERDDDLEKGEGNEYGTEYRQYDARTGRFANVDPLTMALPAYSPYAYGLGNPIRFIDENGDWPGKPSAALEKMGMNLPPLVAGLVDGLADGSPIGMVGMAVDLVTDANFRNEMINAFTEIAKDPVGFLGSMFSEYKDLLERVATGKATPEDMKKIGEEIGSSIAGALTGSAINKIFSKVKLFKKMKIDAGGKKKVPDAQAKSPMFECVSCFTALTKIETKNGLKDIKNIAVGDSVLSFDEQSGKLTYQRVSSRYEKYRDTIVVVYAMGTFIETTNDHPFFVGGEWLRAHQLKAGMLLTLASGETTSIERVELRLERTLVYNFSVENNHTYTVGNHKFLVHNCGPSLKTPGGTTIRNSKLANKTHPVTGVPFDKNGFPDFSQYVYKLNGKPVDVHIGNLTGDVAKDEALALSKAGLKSTPKGYTWHHHQDTGRMQLVEEVVHKKTGHTGGVKLHEEKTGIKYKR